jgi:ArsR family transcriptional regulator
LKIARPIAIFLFRKMRNQTGQPIDQLVSIASAMADPNRIRLLAACLDRERCVCQLVALIDLSNASISKHLGQLRDAGLLESRREGRWVHYRIPDEPESIVRDALSMTRAHSMNDEKIRLDQRTLMNIDAIEPNELARMQREGCCPDLRCCQPHESHSAPTGGAQGA